MIRTPEWEYVHCYPYGPHELYDHERDPNEAHSLAADAMKNGELILAMNEKLNALIDDEVGEDVGQMLPKASGVSWAVTKFDP